MFPRTNKKQGAGQAAADTTPGTNRKAGFRSIRVKLIAAFLVMVVPIAMLGYFSSEKAKDIIYDMAADFTIQTMEQTNSSLGMIFNTISDTSKQILLNQYIQDYLACIRQGDKIFDTEKARTEAKKYLLGLAMTSRMISGIHLILDDKYTISSQDILSLGESFSTITDSQWFISGMENNGKITFSGKRSELDPLFRDPMALSYGMFSSQAMREISVGRTAGLLVIDIKLQEISGIIDRMDFGEGSVVILVSPDGRIIPSSSATGDLKTMENLTGIPKEDFYISALEGEEAFGSDTISYMDNEYLMVYNKVGDSGYMLMGFIPNAQLFSPARAISGFTGILVVIGGIFAVLMGILMATSIGKIINQLIHAASLAENGDLTVELSNKRRDELGFLTDSINKMVVNMRGMVKNAIAIVQKVNESAATVAATAEQVSASSHEISRAIEEISKGASEQASDAEQGVERMNLLASKIVNVSQNAREIGDVTAEAQALSQRGLSVIDELIQRTDETAAITEIITRNIRNLEEQSKSIDKIVKAIDDIAAQTNILALNAAIEAARAGEKGRGFAVVAAEVRNLAEQAANSTKEISEIIYNTQKQTAETAGRAARVEQTVQTQNEAVAAAIKIFKDIADSMQELFNKVDNITEGIREMVAFKDEAVNDMQNISAISQQTAASSQEVTASSEEQLSGIEELTAFAQELSETADALSQATGRFKV